MLVTERPVNSKVNKGLQVSLALSRKKPARAVNFSAGALVLFFPFLAALLILASITIYKNLDLETPAVASGDRLAIISSSQNRELELQRLIDRDNSRVGGLQKENQDREAQVANLEIKLLDLGNNLSLLKTALTQNNSAKAPIPATPLSGYKNSQPVLPTFKPGTLPPVPGPNPNGAYGSYFAELQKLEAQLSSLNQTVAEKKAGLDQLQVSFNDYNAQVVRLTGKEPPLPGAITNLNDAQRLRPPDILPGDGPLTSAFGWRDSPFHPGTRGWHDGVDLACNYGTPVRATKPGLVTFATMDRTGYGLRVDITHENGWLSFYAHNSQLMVKVGQLVNKGDVVGLCGSTGASTGPHIHYGLHYNGVMTDPLRYIPFQVRWAQ